MKPGIVRPDCYDPFARVYERHWIETSQSFIPAVALLLLPRLRAGARLLDLCCGTGSLAADLQDSDVDVIGLDGSRAMLERAKRTAPGVPFVQGDARRFALRPVFDAVVCMFDSLNHMMTPGELGAAFRHVHECLVPGGWFLFDLNTETAYLRHWNGFHRIVDADMTVMCSSSYDTRSRRGVFELRFETASEGSVGDTVTLRQRCHSYPEISSALERSGLMLTSTYAFEQGACVSVPAPDAERVFYLCRRIS
ncbi:MAG: class I SAM-dependent DNA methyltransferase [Chloroflexota bacterium]